MNKLQAVKAFAELEGYETMISTCREKGQSITAIKGKRTIFRYDPTVDKAMTFDAMVKYEVVPYYSHKRVMAIGSDGLRIKTFYTYYNHADKIPMAIIESILKSQGLWK